MAQNPSSHPTVLATQVATLEQEIGILLKDLTCETYRCDAQAELLYHRDTLLTGEHTSF